MNHVQIHRFPYADFIERRVVIGVNNRGVLIAQHIPTPLLSIFDKVFCQIFLILSEGIPKVEKHLGKGIYHFPF